MFAAILVLATPGRLDDFTQTWNEVASAIRTRFYARTTRKQEMEALLEKFGPQAKAAHSRPEFSGVVNAMIRDFRDSHFGFFTDSDQEYYLMDGLSRSDRARQMPEFGAWFADDGYTVKMVLNGSSAEKAGLRKGDEVTQVNGQPFTPIESLRPLIGKTVTLTVRRGSQNLNPEVAVTQSLAMEMFLEASRDSARIIDENGRKIGYFHLWTQASADFRNALSEAVYGKLRETDAFVLDLRDGFGGRPEGFADPFFRPDVWLDWKPSPNSGFRQLFGYGRPLVLLINGGSRSAKEVLSYILKKSHRATLVGQTTAGNVLGTTPQRINDWAYIEIPTVDVLVDGTRLEGKGVSPDVTVRSELGVDGKDLDLAEGLNRLSHVPKAQFPPPIGAAAGH